MHRAARLPWPLVCLALAAPLTSHARGRHVSDDEMARLGFAIELIGVRYGDITPSLGDLVFAGDGLSSGKPAHFRTDGNSAGIVRPRLSELGIEALTVRFQRWFFVGLEFGFQWGPLDGDRAGLVGLDNQITGFGGGLHTGFVYSKGYFDVRGEVTLGGREYNVAILSLDVETCHYKGATYPCQPSASGDQFYVQPRVRAGVHLGSWLTLGAYGGIDIADGVGWVAGGFASLHTPSWAPDMLHADDLGDRFASRR